MAILWFVEIGDPSSGTNRLWINTNGDVKNVNNSYVGAGLWWNLKERIEYCRCYGPKLDKLMEVKVRNFNLIGEETKQIGVIAQELEEVDSRYDLRIKRSRFWRGNTI